MGAGLACHLPKFWLYSSCALYFGLSMSGENKQLFLIDSFSGLTLKEKLALTDARRRSEAVPQSEWKDRQVSNTVQHLGTTGLMEAIVIPVNQNSDRPE